MKKSTAELLQILKNSPNPAAYLEQEKENLTTCPLPEYLNALCARKNTTPAQCIKASGLDRTYAYQIFNGTKLPSRNKVIALGFGFCLSLADMQEMLKCTGYPALYAKSERDSVIIFALHHGCSLIDLNDLLFQMGFALIN